MDEQKEIVDNQPTAVENSVQQVSEAELAKALDNVVERVVEEVHRQQEKEHSGISFLRNMMSMDEARVSALMISLLVSLGFGGYAYLQFGDVSERWTSLIETFAYCVTGINMLATINPRSRLAKVVSNLTEQAEIATQPKPQPAPAPAPAPTPTQAQQQPTPAPEPVSTQEPVVQTTEPVNVQSAEIEAASVQEQSQVQFRTAQQNEFHVVDSKKC